MRRIAVLGCGGSGKTTLARVLGAQLGLPVIHGDLHRAEWERVQPRFLQRQAWVIDAMRLGSLEERLGAADTAIFIDRSTIGCFVGVLRRRLRYGGGLHAGSGVADFINWEFLRWIATFRCRYRAGLLELLARHASSTTVIVLRSNREIAAYIRSLS